jgi:hypothetical protein
MATPSSVPVLRINARLITTGAAPIFQNLKVELWEMQGKSGKPMQAASPDAEGRVSFLFSGKAAQTILRNKELSLYFKVFEGDTLLTDTSLADNLLFWTLDVGDEELRLHITYKTDPNEPWLRVFGVLRNQYGELLSGTVVQVFDRDLRKAQLLGRCVTEKGRYEVRYKKAQFLKAEKDAADIQVNVVDAAGKELVKTAIHYNAPAELEVNLQLDGSEYKGPSEFEKLSECLLPLLDGVTPLDLREDDEFQDVSFLAGETGFSQLTIGNWIGAHRLAARVELKPEVLYGFLRQGQPGIAYENLLDDIKYPERMMLLEEEIIRDISLFAPERQRGLLEKAVAENYIPGWVLAEINRILEVFAKLKLQSISNEPFGPGKGSIGALLKMTPATAAEQTVFLNAYQAYKGPIDGLWTNLEVEHKLPPKTVQEMKTTFELGAHARNYLPMVAELKRILAGASGNPANTTSKKGSKDKPMAMRDFARYSSEQWKSVVLKKDEQGNIIGFPANIDGEDDNEKAEIYAHELTRSFERRYPTTAFSANLSRQDGSPVTQKVEVVKFLDNNEAFDLAAIRVDQFIAQNPESLKGVANPQEMLVQVKAIQRVFKLSPRHETVNSLLSQKIHSSQQIYFKGKEQFIADATLNGINALEANNIFQKAESQYALSLVYLSNYNLNLNGVTPYAAPGISLTDEQQAQVAALPNMQSLFGSQDYCECSHCRSVYSPAAYFVDVMHFLGQRDTKVTTGAKVRDVLLGRLPHLGEMELSCENTNTPLPYIDLVNEVLEDVVEPPTPVGIIDYATNIAFLTPSATNITTWAMPVGLRTLLRDPLINIPIDDEATVYDRDLRPQENPSTDAANQWGLRDKRRAYRLIRVGTKIHVYQTRQTFWTAAELRANPEYTNGAAYNTLRLEVFPFNLPFDFWSVQTRAYLTHLGVPQPRLFELFQKAAPISPTALQIETAYLGLTEPELKIINGTYPGKQAWDFWGLKDTGNSIPHPDMPATVTLTGSWLSLLSNVPVMLHRSGLKYTELLQLLEMSFIDPLGGIYINTFTNTNASICDASTFVIMGLEINSLNRIHRFIRLWRKMDCPIWELNTLVKNSKIGNGLNDTTLSNLSTLKKVKEYLRIDWMRGLSLFDAIDHTTYLDRSKSGSPIVQTLYQRLFRNKLVDATSIFPDDATNFSTLFIDDASIPGILAGCSIKEAELDVLLPETDAISPTASLRGQPLSLDVLSKFHRYSLLAKGLKITVAQLVQLKRLIGIDPFASIANCWKFINAVDKIKASGFGFDELDYLLQHRFAAGGGVGLEDAKITTIVTAIRDGLLKVNDDILKKTEESNADYIASKLGLLTTIPSDEGQAIALAIVNCTWTESTANRDSKIALYFTGVLANIAAAQSTISAIYAIDPLADPANYPKIREDAINAWHTTLQQGLETYLLKQQKEASIKQTISSQFGMDLVSSDLLLTGLILVSGNLLVVLNNNNLLVRSLLGDLPVIEEPTFPDIFKAIRLLHKNALLIRKLSLTPEKTAGILANATAMNWIVPSDIPIDNTSSIAFPTWENMVDFFEYEAMLPASGLTSIDFLDKMLDALGTDATRRAALASVMDAVPADIDDLLNHFGWGAASNVDFLKSSNLLRVQNCLAAMNRLGVNAATAIGWAIPEPTQPVAESLKQTVKARYDLKQWQEVIRPLQDVFREQKRDALAGYLIANAQQSLGQYWAIMDDLYSHFLIDVEMSSCMLTSRIKQATASAQLFVQRCFLNLERLVAINTTTDGFWLQWKWMKYYRLWEANRKIFLYPENWLEPELRDDKSPFFLELEQALMQNDVTQEHVEQAYLDYLEKLDKVDNLDVRAMYRQIQDPYEILHVFARTRSSKGAEYFYRKRYKLLEKKGDKPNKGRWGGWERVPLEIAGDHLVPAIHNGRFHLLWPQFLEKADPVSTVKIPKATEEFHTVTPPTKYWEIRLFWSELKKKKWTPKVLSDNFMKVNQISSDADQQSGIHFRVRNLPQIAVRLYQTKSDKDLTAPESRFGFDKTGKQITIREFRALLFEGPDKKAYEYLIAPPSGTFLNGMIRNFGGNYYFYHNTITETHALDPHQDAKSILLLENVQGVSNTVLYSNVGAFPNIGSFFFVEDRRSYFVDYEHKPYLEFNSFENIWMQKSDNTFQFYLHYHPFVELFIKELNIHGIPGLLNRRIQVEPRLISGAPPIFNFTDYDPNPLTVAQTYPEEEVDFSYTGPYSLYNWELFFHVPKMIADRLAKNQRFEEALQWYSYIFDPTSTDKGDVPDGNTPQQKYWITKPFYETTSAEYNRQKIENLLMLVAQGDADLKLQVAEWRAKPYAPHLIAQMRTVAYQKNVVIKLVEMLIAWGDQLFRRATIETINEATQLYILANAILGPRPKSIPRDVANPVKTYYQLMKEGIENEGIDAFGNALIDVENILPPVIGGGGGSSTRPPILPNLNLLYFCIPNNENILRLWDLVAERLWNIRHCKDIEGRELVLPLFEPPIDPGMLASAAAAGVDIGSVLSDSGAPMPNYRFSVILQRAMELCNEVKALGGAMLSALEKKDGEGLALLRSSNELIMLDAVKNIREKQIEEATFGLQGLEQSKKLIEKRKAYYDKLIKDGWTVGEILSFGLSTGSLAIQPTIIAGHGLAAILSLFPNLDLGAAGFGATPTVKLKFGGPEVRGAISEGLSALSVAAGTLDKASSLAATTSSYRRREEEWGHQRDLAELELPQIEKQIEAAKIRLHIAQKELANHELQQEQREKEDEYMRTKYTNQELYSWMIGQLSGLYFQSYQLAYDVAKRAERCFRYELGLSDSNYIQFGYWDSLNKGLLSGEKLYYDLKRLEMAYYEQNRREYELTKHISLANLDPAALLLLRQNGECFVDIPEVVYNMDYPSHYFRRLKTVSMSIPCIAGPSTTVACTLTMLGNSLRKDTTGVVYERDLVNDDSRFRDEIAAIQSIATSRAQNDSGMFELNFRDERYLPFEGAGAISKWHIKLNKDFRQFDYNTITDVMLQISYTAREGGATLQAGAVAAFHEKLNAMALAANRTGLYRVFDLKREFQDSWHKFLFPANVGDEQELVLDNLADRLPYFTRSFATKNMVNVEIVAKMKTHSSALVYSLLFSPVDLIEKDLIIGTKYKGMHNVNIPVNSVDLTSIFDLKIKKKVGATDFKSLPTDEIEEMFLLVKYTIE